MKYSADYRAVARQKLDDRWLTSALVFLLYSLITGAVAIIPGVGSIASLILTGPATVGLTIYFIKVHNSKKGEKVGIATIFEGFFDMLGAIGVYIFTAIYTFFWSLLFVIPGIIKSYSYSMAFFLKAKKPELSGNEAISLSSEIMYGKRFQLFCLHFSFFGWAVLSILTLGIGLFFLIPYMEASSTAFYEDAYSEYLAKYDVVELSEGDVVITPAKEESVPEQKQETREEQVSKIINASNIKDISDYTDQSDNK